MTGDVALIVARPEGEGSAGGVSAAVTGVAGGDGLYGPQHGQPCVHDDP